jgi:hypothetical protein
MSGKNTSKPEIYPQKDHLPPGDDPGEVMRRRDGASPPHAQEKAPAPKSRVTQKDNDESDEETTE